MDNKKKSPKWLEEIEQLANEQLGEGSACKQVHPIVEAWYDQLMDSAPPVSRDSVIQAIACLSTEILLDMLDEVPDSLVLDDSDETDLALWIQQILMVGRAFQQALDSGELDDL